MQTYNKIVKELEGAESKLKEAFEKRSTHTRLDNMGIVSQTFLTGYIAALSWVLRKEESQIK